MKKMTTKLLSIILALSLIFSMSVPTFAYSKHLANNMIIKDTISYIDSDGNTCLVDITIDPNLKLVTTESEQARSVFNLNNKKVSTSYSNGSSTVKEFELPNVIPNSTPYFSARASSSYWGTVKYKTYYDPYIGDINDSLKVYATNNGTVKDEYIINGEQYDVASEIIGFAVSYLVGLGIEKWASHIIKGIWAALATEGIVKVSDGIIKKAFTTTVTAQNTYYDVEAVDPATDRSNSYEGSMHKVVAPGAHYSEVYYEGYYPQFLSKNDNAVAYWMFCDFWAYSYPGVKSYN